MLATRFTSLVGCRAPIQQAAMGPATTSDLVAAVTGAGGLGMIAGVAQSADQLERTIAEVRARTDGPFGVNLIVPLLDRDVLAVAIASAPLIEYFYAPPDPELVEAAHAGGAQVSWQIGSAQEAIGAQDAGCDLVVAQAVEAGGHVRGTTALLPLLDAVLDAVDVPVLGAGGIATARGLAAVLAMGADGVRVGTRFVATRESGAHPAYVDALVAAGAADTVLTEAFGVMWPHAPHRVLSSCVDAAAAFIGPTVGEMHTPDGPMPLPPWHVHAPTADTTGAIEAMALYAGQSVGAIDAVTPAADVVCELTAGAQRLLDAAAGPR
jgi:NAD(P)H-dependent flavin oxidoreductase YrpB (nitropropane dioxygenase family)